MTLTGNTAHARKTRKYDDAAKYSASYNPDWSKQYPVTAAND